MDPGLDTSTFTGKGYTPGLDLLGNALTEEESIIQDMLRAVTEQPGVLFWAPRATINISGAIQAGLTDADVSSIEAAVKELFADDPRYETFDAAVTLSRGTLELLMTAVTVSGLVLRLKVTDDGSGLEYERLT